MRIKTMLAGMTAVAALALTISATMAGTASAAPTQCKDYDQLLQYGKGRLCLYTAANNPSWKARAYVGNGGPCDPLLPLDIDDAHTDIYCFARPSISAWRWNAGWTAAHLTDGLRWVYPYGGDWRWAYDNGSWYAVDAASVHIRWFCPASGAACFSV